MNDSSLTKIQEHIVHCHHRSPVSNCTGYSDDFVCCLKEIVREAPPVFYEERAITILNRFLKDPELYCLPVLRDGRICGLINRHRFMENHMIGRSGYGYSVNYYKPVGPLLEDSFLLLDQYTTIEHAATLIEKRDLIQMYDDICVSDNGIYSGIVSVSDILSAITKNNLALAIGANPLSGLPGNDFIQRKIRALLAESKPFDICYIDIDFFKPYNDRHGFARGDEVIQSVADCIGMELDKHRAEPTSFAGHIGGDDFIILTTPGLSVDICQGVVDRFEGKHIQFHGAEEVAAGYYEGLNRKDERERFPLLSLSIAIISTEGRRYSSYAEISSVASGLKKKAKQQSGSVILKDQRSGNQNAFIACEKSPLAKRR
jgi:diguanylate cyclase (GGDEF)-like protein